MAKKLSTQARLKLSVDDALAKIKSLSAELKQVKTQVDQPLKLDVQVDMGKFNSQLNDVKKALGGGRNTKGQFSTIANDIRAIRTELTNLSRTLTSVVGGLTNASKEANKFSNNLNRSFSGNNQQITGLVNNVEQFNVSLRKSSEESRSFKSNVVGAFAAASTGLSSLLSGMDKAYSGFRSIGTTFLSTIGNIATQSLDIVGFSVTGMVDEAMEQERKLQQSKIGFGNMFRGQDTDAMVRQVRQTAASSPGLNSGDLADYINQLGAVSGGQFDTAFNATMGILKTVSYGGGDANSQMGYIIKNVRDVMAKGKATQVDIQQFNRAMPLLAKAMESIGASEFLKDGQLTITKDNASKLMEAFAKLNTPDNPAYNIFEQTSKTLAGIQEEFKEATASAIAEGLEGIGFFDALANVARDSLLPEIQGDIQGFFKWVGEISKEIDWNVLKQEIGAVVVEVKGLVGELATYFKDNFLNTDTLKLAVQIIGEFIKGLLEGAKGFLEMINGLRQWLGDDGLKNLASSLGKAVTQGWIFSKVLSLVAGGFETFSHVAQASFFLRQNVGGGGGAAAAAAGGGIASKIGGAVSSLTGGRVAASSVASRISTVTRFGKGLLKGGAVTLLTSAASDLVRSFNLLSDASGVVADSLKVGGAAIGGAIAGQVLGPLGMLGGALIGAVISIKQMQDEAYEKQAREDAERGTAKMIKAKDSQREEVIQAAIGVMRENGFTFDERTEAAGWAKSQVADYLNNTEAHDWNADNIYDRLVAAYRQKLGHERMVQADNDDGFWNLQGAEANYLKKNDKGENELTEWGERLVKLIRDYNLVGHESQADLENTADETLVREYLQGDSVKLNTAQIEYLEKQAAKFEEEVGNDLTASKDKIQAAIEAAGGDLSQAIEDAKTAGDESWAAVLEAYRALKQKAEGVTEVISMGTFGDTRWSDETATELFGGRGKDAINSWNDKGFLWQNGTYFKNVYGTDNIGDLIKQVYDASKIAKIDMGNSAISEDEQRAAAQRYDAMSNLLSQFFDTDLGTSGDWDRLKEAFAPLTYALGTTYQYKDLGGQDLFDNKLKGPIWDQKAWEAEDWLQWLKAMGYLQKIPTGGSWAHGGEVKPIYRASGGGTGRGVDIVPAYLQPGEFVQRQSAVQKAGLGVMNALNNGDLSAAYKLIGAKLSNTWNHNRTTNSNSDNRRYQSNMFFIRNQTNAGRAGTRNSIANRLALGH